MPRARGHRRRWREAAEAGKAKKALELQIKALTFLCTRRRRISAAGLGRELGVSQQTASRVLTQLEVLGLVERDWHRNEANQKAVDWLLNHGVQVPEVPWF